MHELPTGRHARAGNFGRVAAPGSGTPPPDCKYANGVSRQLTVSLEVSFNGVDFTTDSMVAFTWFNRSAIALSHMHPTAGPAAGGTLVNISGDRFADYGVKDVSAGARCQFGAAIFSPITEATVHSHDRISCYSPPVPDGAPLHQSVFISLNGYADARTLMGRSEGDVDSFGRGGGVGQSGGVLTFRYDPVPQRAVAVHPLGAPRVGGTVLTISAATRFTDDGTPLCLFGSSNPLAVPAFVTVDGHALECRAPPLDELIMRGARPPGDWCARPGRLVLTQCPPAPVAAFMFALSARYAHAQVRVLCRRDGPVRRQSICRGRRVRCRPRRHLQRQRLRPQLQAHAVSLLWSRAGGAVGA